MFGPEMSKSCLNIVLPFSAFVSTYTFLNLVLGSIPVQIIYDAWFISVFSDNVFSDKIFSDNVFSHNVGAVWVKSSIYIVCFENYACD